MRDSRECRDERKTRSIRRRAWDTPTCRSTATVKATAHLRVSICEPTLTISASRNRPQTDVFPLDKIGSPTRASDGVRIHGVKKSTGIPDPCVCDRTFGHGRFYDLRAGFSPVLGRSSVGRFGQSSVRRLGLGRLGRSPPTKARARLFPVLRRTLRSPGASRR